MQLSSELKTLADKKNLHKVILIWAFLVAQVRISIEKRIFQSQCCFAAENGPTLSALWLARFKHTTMQLILCAAPLKRQKRPEGRNPIRSRETRSGFQKFLTKDVIFTLAHD